MLFLSALVGAIFATTTFAHMQLHYPPPFNASNNPHRTTPADPYLQYPYDCCGPNDRWEYPCRGYISLLGTPQGAPTATWTAGSLQTWNVTGIGNHYGGSCQVGFSTDKGKTFRVARSYEGNCPHRNGGLGPEGQDFQFSVPDDLETGVQVFAWIWYNREQEFNMNCAAVNITRPSGTPNYPSPTTTTTSCSDKTASDVIEKASVATTSPLPIYKTGNNCSCTCDSPVKIGTCICDCSYANVNSAKRRDIRDMHQHADKHSVSTATARRSPETQYIAFNQRPLMLIADDGNGCETPKTTAELKYPDPGPDLLPGDGVYPLELPIGNCTVPGDQAYHGSHGNDGHM